MTPEKLFNALEQIRRNETYNVPGTSGLPSPVIGKGQKIRAIALIVVVLIAGAFFFIELPTSKNKEVSSGFKPNDVDLVSSLQRR